VILDMFCELQRAAPWNRQDEATLIAETLEQARLADELGYGCWWSVEHHGAGSFSLSSTPELFNVLVSQHTSRIRIGHSGVLSPVRINHPIRVAERSAFLDVVSGGRLEMGLARSAGAEWDTFEVDGPSTREQMAELLRMLPRMWNDERFSWNSEWVNIPERTFVPKPLQQPHPPLWQTCTSPEAFSGAGRLGVGAIGTTLLAPIDNLKTLHAAYRAGLEACTEPAGETVNDNFAVFAFVHCAETREEAVRRAVANGVLWYFNTAPQIFQTPRSILINEVRGALAPNDAGSRVSTDKPVIREDLDRDDPLPIIRLLNRHALGEELDPEEAFDVLDELDSVIIGDPNTCLRKMKRYADIGVDRLMCFQQFGDVANDAVMDSIRLVGTELLPKVGT
jgi:alkanesulfonate monooxygenase SsuD/methylene tetrahydromethanopterin reductase-like flavin-dependent oxidoreductase (luciferase family)